MRAHVGIVQIHIVLLYRYDAVHRMLHRGTLVTLYGAPLTIDDIFLGYKRIQTHQFLLDTILYLLHGDKLTALTGKIDYGLDNIVDTCSFFVHTPCAISLDYRLTDFLRIERLHMTITLYDAKDYLFHCNTLL